MINPIDGISAGLPVMNTPSVSGPTGPRTAAADSISEMLFSNAMKAAETMRGAETTAAAGMVGEAGTREVVDAVMRAEQALKTSIAIRDKIVTAYLEVSRMAI